MDVRFFAPDEIPFDSLAFQTHRDALTQWKAIQKTRG
jgi:hypothetical protein